MSEVTRAEFEELKQVVEAQSERIAELEREKRELADTLEDATILADDDGTGRSDGEDGQDADSEQDDVDDEADLEERVADLEQQTDLHFQDICNLEMDTRDLTERVEDLETGEHGTDDENTDARPTVEPQTHLEDLAGVPSRLTEDQSPNARRALFVARDIREYTESVHEGRVITWSQLRIVLGSGCGNNYPETIRRVMDLLDDLGEDETKIVNKDHLEKRVWFSDEIVARLEHLCNDDEVANTVVSQATG